MTKEDKIRQKLTERKRIANQQNAAKLAKSKAYQEAAPTPANLYNAFINWFLGTKQLGGQSQYQTGNAPVGGRRGQLLNLQQLRNLKSAIQRSTKRAKYEQDAKDAFMQELEDVPVVINGRRQMFPGRARQQIEAEPDIYEHMADQDYYMRNPYHTFDPNYENWNPNSIYDTSVGFWPGVNMKEFIYP